MKKIYLSLAAAVAVCASSSAAVDYTSMQAVEMEKANVEALSSWTMASGVTENGPMRAATKANAEGNHIYDYYSLKAEGGGAKTRSVQINFKDDKNVEIIGLYYDFPVSATFDASAGTIRIAKQVMFKNTYYNEDVILFPQHIELITDANGNVTDEKHNDIDYIEFIYAPNGVQMNDGTTAYQGCWVCDSMDLITLSMASIVAEGSGFDWMFQNVFETIEYRYGEKAAFEYKESEWSTYGTAQMLQDGWLLSNAPAWEVPVLVNKANNKHFLLVDPYGPNTPLKNDNESTEGGFIYINAENAECVLVKPFIYGGFTNEEMAGAFYFTSKEGSQYYIEGYQYEEIIEEAEFYGDALPTYDAATGIIDLPNCRFSLVYSLPTAEEWVNSSTKEPMPMVGQLKLIAGAGVEGVINDTENVAKRYFNLQGVEIANPEAGQVVIVKEGNKTSKTIVR